MDLQHTGHVARGGLEEEEEEEEVMCLSRQAEQKEWRQKRVLTGRVKSSRHTGHVSEDLRSSISFLRSEEREDSEEEEDMEDEGLFSSFSVLQTTKHETMERKSLPINDGKSKDQRDVIREM